MAGHSEAECLGCGREFKVPTMLFNMAERYSDGRLVLFCGKACNFKFVERIGRETQEKDMRELLERLENPS
ncbi:MAG: hypothetical protein V3S98_06235 [Dehalococcoidia bacterium]